VTKPRKHIGILPNLPFSARRWLLGARPYFDENDELRNSGIVRLRHLVVGGGDENWAAYLAALRREYGPLVREKREIWRQRKAAARERAREARKRAREARREVADPSSLLP
jgi:sugar phosphate isomerase/epimerase